jgi:TonB family protein
MKPALLILLSLPFISLAQKVKINEYDKFIKQRRIEMEPVTIMATSSAKISLTYNCIGSTFYVLMNGFGWGVSSISAENELIFLLSNDSTLTLRSTGVQMYEVGMPNNTFKHKYFISLPEIEALSRNELVGIRKYTVQDHADMKVIKQYTPSVKKLSSLFIEELKKGRVLLPLYDIDAKVAAKHVGDSVRICSKLFSSRYLDSSINRPVLLNVGANYPNQLVTVVIPEEDRAKFNNMPDVLYDKKKVCVCGVVQLHKNKPQIIVRDRAQMRIKTPIHLDEVPMYVGDSVTIYGKVASSKYYPDVANSPTLLFMGGGFPNQKLTVIIEGVDGKPAEENKENFYAEKEIVVEGKLVMSKGKPQLQVYDDDQITVMRQAATAVTAMNAEKNDKSAVKNASMTMIQKAEFPGGFVRWQEFLNKNIIFPEELEVGESKKVVARVSIDKDGSLRVLNIAQSAGRAFDNEVLRVLKKAPKWNPELQNGIPVPVTLALPITFERIPQQF